MFKKYFSQSIGQLRQHPLISALTIMATALSLFLIMVVVMIQQVKVAPYSPESNRDRFLHARYVSISSKNWNSDDSANGPMSMKFINECYKSLETPEAITIYALGALPASVGLKNGAMIVANVKETDDQFFRVFDLSFVEGRAYDKAEYEARRPLAIITETMAKKLYGTSTGVVGRELLVSYMPCQVLGVVKDVSNLTNNAYANIWIPVGVG